MNANSHHIDLLPSPVRSVQRECVFMAHLPECPQLQVSSIAVRSTCDAVLASASEEQDSLYAVENASTNLSRRLREAIFFNHWDGSH
jgi:hypothetical protein